MTGINVQQRRIKNTTKHIQAYQTKHAMTKLTWQAKQCFEASTEIKTLTASNMKHSIS